MRRNNKRTMKKKYGLKHSKRINRRKQSKHSNNKSNNKSNNRSKRKLLMKQRSKRKTLIKQRSKRKTYKKQRNDNIRLRKQRSQRISKRNRRNRTLKKSKKRNNQKKRNISQRGGMSNIQILLELLLSHNIIDYLPSSEIFKTSGERKYLQMITHQEFKLFVDDHPEYKKSPTVQKIFNYSSEELKSVDEIKFDYESIQCKNLIVKEERKHYVRLLFLYLLGCNIKEREKIKDKDGLHKKMESISSLLSMESPKEMTESSMMETSDDISGLEMDEKPTMNTSPFNKDDELFSSDISEPSSLEKEELSESEEKSSDVSETLESEKNDILSPLPAINPEAEGDIPEIKEGDIPSPLPAINLEVEGDIPSPLPAINLEVEGDIPKIKEGDIPEIKEGDIPSPLPAVNLEVEGDIPSLLPAINPEVEGDIPSPLPAVNPEVGGDVVPEIKEDDILSPLPAVNPGMEDKIIPEIKEDESISPPAVNPEMGGVELDLEKKELPKVDNVDSSNKPPIPMPIVLLGGADMITDGKEALSEFIFEDVNWFNVCLGIEELDRDFENMVMVSLRNIGLNVNKHDLLKIIKKLLTDIEPGSVGYYNVIEIMRIIKIRLMACCKQPRTFLNKLFGGISYSSYYSCDRRSKDSILYLYDEFQKFLDSDVNLTKSERILLLIFIEERQHLLTRYVSLELLRQKDKNFSKIQMILDELLKLDKEIIEDNENKLAEIKQEEIKQAEMKQQEMEKAEEMKQQEMGELQEISPDMEIPPMDISTEMDEIPLSSESEEIPLSSESEEISLSSESEEIPLSSESEEISLLSESEEIPLLSESEDQEKPEELPINEIKEEETPVEPKIVIGGGESMEDKKNIKLNEMDEKYKMVNIRDLCYKMDERHKKEKKVLKSDLLIINECDKH